MHQRADAPQSSQTLAPAGTADCTTSNAASPAQYSRRKAGCTPAISGRHAGAEVRQGHLSTRWYSIDAPEAASRIRQYRRNEAVCAPAMLDRRPEVEGQWRHLSTRWNVINAPEAASRFPSSTTAIRQLAYQRYATGAGRNNPGETP